MECIVHLTSSFGCGGLERVIANLISEDQSPKTKHVVISLSNDLSFAYALPDGVEIHTVNKQPGLDLHAHIRVGKLLKQVGATVLHTYNFGSIEYHAVAKLCGVKCNVHADHGLGGDDPEGKNNKRNLFRRMISSVIDHYIVVSDDLKQWVTNTVRVPEKKVHFVFNGVPVPPPQSLLKRPSGKLHLVIVGRLAKVKNHQRLLYALTRIQSEHPELKVTCDIVGDGPLRDVLKETISEMSYPERVVLQGMQEDVHPFLKKSDALILTSDYEAMPMTVLEAMAACRPVICPDVGGVSDFLTQDDVNLIPGKNNDALVKAIVSMAQETDDDYQEKVANAYIKVRDNYSLSKMTERYLEFFAK